MTILIVCTYIPQILISFVAGSLGDMYNKKFLIIISDIVTAIATLILSIFLTFGSESLIVIFSVTVVRSIGTGIQSPIENAILPEICDKKQLPKINGINATLNSIIAVTSPALGGLLLGTIGINMTVLADVLTAFIAIILLIKITINNEYSTPRDTNPNFLHSFFDGVEYFKKNIFLNKLLMFYILFYFFISAPAFLTNIFVSRYFGGEVFRLTFNEVSWAIGNFIGGLIVYFYKKNNRLLTMAISSSLFGLFISLLGLTTNFKIYLLIMFTSGIFMPIFNSSNILLIQENITHNMLGRTFSNIQILSTISTTMGIVIFGVISDNISLRLVLSITGLCIFVLSFLIFSTYHKIKLKNK